MQLNKCTLYYILTMSCMSVLTLILFSLQSVVVEVHNVNEPDNVLIRPQILYLHAFHFLEETKHTIKNTVFSVNTN